MPMLPMPTQCPVTGGPLLVTRLECEESGVTIISATHDLKMIDVSDRVIHIRDGQVERVENRSDIDLEVGTLGE